MKLYLILCNFLLINSSINQSINVALFTVAQGLLRNDHSRLESVVRVLPSNSISHEPWRHFTSGVAHKRSTPPFSVSAMTTREWLQVDEGDKRNVISARATNIAVY